MRSSKVLTIEQIFVVTIFLFVGVSLANARIIIISDRGFQNPESNRYKFSKSEIEMFEKDLQEKTGLQSLRFNQESELDYSVWEQTQSGSQKMRESIIAAIDDELNVFQMTNHSNSANVHFAQTDVGTVDVHTQITIYQTRFDMADFRSAERYSDAQALESFTLGLNLFHEINHKVNYDIYDTVKQHQVRPETSSATHTGVRENTNFIRQELDLIKRDTKQTVARKFSRNVYEVLFIDDFGEYKYLRWKLK